MTVQPTSASSRICPTCGARLADDATRCPVCGADVTPVSTDPRKAAKPVQGSRMPEITLSLPVAMILLTLFLGIGAVSVFFALRQTGQVAVPPTVTPTETPTQTPTLTPTIPPPTMTNTPEPTATPVTYQVQSNDSCVGIAFTFGVSVQSIILLNNLSAACDLQIGDRLLIPQPTPTVTPLATSTLSPAEATEQACEKVTYVPQENDTLSSIAQFYGVPMAAIRAFNGLTSDVVFVGVPLVIPLCEREPTPGPTPTFTPPPPYPAPNLLLPADGSVFGGTANTISLQWASVGALNDNEFYVITIVDLTVGQSSRLVEYVTDTAYSVPRSLRSADGAPHIYRWTVGTARRVGSDSSGAPIYESAGVVSNGRVFAWSGVSGTPVP